MWDPQRYLARAAERGRPFTDLLARVGSRSPSTVVDLGCGPGNLTAMLAERWPAARVIGVDSSPEMVAAARATGLEVVEADLREWRPPAPIDVLVSNATLQWVPDHRAFLPDLVGWLAPGGWLAVQVPGNYGEPAHVLLGELAESDRWRDRIGAGRVSRPAVHEPAEYLATLAALGCEVDAWETTYLHVLSGEDAVLDWMTGTALRPVLAVLDDAERREFLAAYGGALNRAYPRQPHGTVLPFRRVFAVARRGA